MNRHKLCNHQMCSIPLRTHNIIRHINLNQILLLSVGLWPYHQSKFVQFRTLLFLGILISFIVFLFSRFLFVDCTFDFVVKILSLALVIVMVTMMYMTFWINNKSVKYLLDHMNIMYEKLQDETEITILNKYGSSAKRYTIIFLLFAVCSSFAIVSSGFIPFFFDIIVAKNHSYSQHSKEMISKFFVMQEKYCYLIILHLSMAVWIGVITSLAIGTISVAYITQACGLFKIASYRIKRAMANNILENNNLMNAKLMYEGIIRAVDIHRIAMEYSIYIISWFEGTMLALVLCNGVCLSLNLFQIVNITLKTNDMDMEIIVLHMGISLGCYIVMFFSNYWGQEVTDHNNHIFFTAYNMRWYLAPLHVQKLIFFLLQRSNRIFCIKVCGLFPGSLEGFASLISTAISYFTVMLSLQ